MYKGTFKFYEVGGRIRDELLGISSKDIDYVAIPNPERIAKYTSVDDLFSLLVEDIKLRGYEIYLIKPRDYTIRAKMGSIGVTADFVLAHKPTGHVGRISVPDFIPATLEEDLARRDFTVNAIAKDPLTGKYIDPFGGVKDIQRRTLATPIDGSITFKDDPLRLLRAIRFAITKDFTINHNIQYFLHSFNYEVGFESVAEDRIREEITKCFKHNTLKTINYLQEFFALKNYIFNKTNLWLKPTNER